MSTRTIDGRELRHIILLTLGTAFLIGAMVSPWWTRGGTISSDACPVGAKSCFADDANRPPGIEGGYANYGPFRTPGSAAGFTTDASRGFAVAILGVSMLLCQMFAFTHLLVRRGMGSGRINANADVPVRLAMAAFMAGAFAVLWGALALPALGNHPGFLWGGEYGTQLAQESGIFHVTRYANAGIYLALVGAVAYPAYLWSAAATARRDEQWSFGTTTANIQRPVDA